MATLSRCTPIALVLACVLIRAVGLHWCWSVYCLARTVSCKLQMFDQEAIVETPPLVSQRRFATVLNHLLHDIFKFLGYHDVTPIELLDLRRCDACPELLHGHQALDTGMKLKVEARVCERFVARLELKRSQQRNDE